MANYKIVFTGPVGAGKSTAINSISDIPVITTDEMASDMTRLRKQTTTVAMDYGRLNIGKDERIHLYGTPGQERFNFMWDILIEGGLGLILLIDNSRADPLRDLRFFIDAFRDFISETSVVIGVTRMDLKQTPILEDYYEAIETLPKRPPIFEVDAREGKDVSLLVQTLLYSLDPGIQI